MSIDLEKIMKDTKVNLINCTINNYVQEEKKKKPIVIGTIPSISMEEIEGQVEKEFNKLIKYIQSRIGFTLSGNAIKEVLQLESDYFMNLNLNNGEPL